MATAGSVAALACVAAVCCLVLRQQSRALSLLVSLAACVGLLLLGVGFFQPVLEVAEELRELAGLDRETTGPLFKILGVGLLTQLAAGVCRDAGEGAVASTVELVGGLLTFYAGLPLLKAVLELVRELLEGIS